MPHTLSHTSMPQRQQRCRWSAHTRHIQVPCLAFPAQARLMQPACTSVCHAAALPHVHLPNTNRICQTCSWWHLMMPRTLARGGHLLLPAALTGPADAQRLSPLVHTLQSTIQGDSCSWCSCRHQPLAHTSHTPILSVHAVQHWLHVRAAAAIRPEADMRQAAHTPLNTHWLLATLLPGCLPAVAPFSACVQP